jgi:hypothetical protein
MSTRISSVLPPQPRATTGAASFSQAPRWPVKLARASVLAGLLLYSHSFQLFRSALLFGTCCVILSFFFFHVFPIQVDRRCCTRTVARLRLK